MEIKIFDVLKEINRGNTGYIDKLSSEELKSIKPYVLMLWIKGAQDNPDAHTILTNLMVNSYIFSLGNHPKLLFKLLCVANGGYDNTKFYWKHKKKSSSNFRETVIEDYYDYNSKEAKDAVLCLSDETIQEIAQELGYDDKDIKKGLK